MLSIPLYLPQERARLSQAEVGERLAFSQLAQSLQQLATQVASSYFAVLQAQDAVAVAEAQGAAIQEQFEAARESYAAGNATITDQQEAQARLDLNRAQLAAARNTLISRQASFTQLTGLPGTHLNPLPGNAPLRPVPPEPQAWWEAQARTRSFLVQQAELGMEAARRGLDAAKAAHYPSVGIVSQAATQHGQTNLTVDTPIQRSRDVSAMLQVQVPLYAGGSLQALERAQAATLGKRESQLEAARRGAAQQARDTYLALQSSLQQAEALQAAVRSSQLALESNNTGYQAGVRINVDVLNAQQQLFQARQNLAATRYAVLLNQLRLKAAIGGLGPSAAGAGGRAGRGTVTRPLFFTCTLNLQADRATGRCAARSPDVAVDGADDSRQGQLARMVQTASVADQPASSRAGGGVVFTSGTAGLPSVRSSRGASASRVRSRAPRCACANATPASDMAPRR